LTDVGWCYVKKLWREVTLISHMARIKVTTFDHDFFFVIVNLKLKVNLVGDAIRIELSCKGIEWLGK
jgi:hypothetical protein